MTALFPADRIQLDVLATRSYRALGGLSGSVGLDPGLRHLVNVRASMVNGCAFCIDMHWKDARAAGETEERLYSLAAWAESPLYDERERAALLLCDAVTLVAEGHVADPVWASAEAAFEPEELAHLVFAIIVINAWNRLSITARTVPGSYEPTLRSAA